jgi:hypothetical protein
MAMKIKNEPSNELSDKEVAQRRDDLIRRALRTPPTPLKEMKKKRDAKGGAPPSKRDEA